MRRLIYVIAYTGRFGEMREFYGQGLGLPERHAERDWVEFDTAGASLALHHTDDPEREGTILRFETENLDALLDDLAERGVEPAFGVTEAARGRLADVWDADGNLVSLLQPALPVPSGAGPRMTAVILNVADMVAATAFYRDQFGLTALVQSPWWTEFDAGATRVSLHPRVAPTDDLRHNAQPIVIGFASPSLDELEEELGDRGVSFSGGPVEQRYGRFAEVEDPDGNVVLFRESGARHAPSVEELAEMIEGDEPHHVSMHAPGKKHPGGTSRLVVKPDYKPGKTKKPPTAAKAAAAASAGRAKKAPSVRGEGASGTRREPVKRSDPERVKTRPAVGHLKKAERRTLADKKRAVATASRAKPVKRAAAKRVVKRGSAKRGR
jgi:predicted enzyme related to lactoylglutathione lyase